LNLRNAIGNYRKKYCGEIFIIIVYLFIVTLFVEIII